MGFFTEVKERATTAIKNVTFKNNPLHKVDDVINKNLGGYGNLAMGAGIVAASVLTGGVAAAGAGTAFSSGGAIAGGVTGSLIGGASVGSGIEGRKAEREANAQAAAQQAEVDRANALAEAQRRANLYSLRKQVGAVGAGSKSTIFSGGGSATKDTATSVVLG